MIETYISGFNSAIESNLGSAKDSCTINGIAQPIYVLDAQEVMLPAVTIDGNDMIPFIDDEYYFGIYHKVNRKTYLTEKAKGFGDSSKLTCTADCSLVAWGFNRILSAEDLETYILSNCPETITIKTTDFDKKRVFNSEFANVQFDINEETFLFKIEYQVLYKINKSCLEINEIFNS